MPIHDFSPPGGKYIPAKQPFRPGAEMESSINSFFNMKTRFAIIYISLKLFRSLDRKSIFNLFFDIYLLKIFK